MSCSCDIPGTYGGHLLTCHAMRLKGPTVLRLAAGAGGGLRYDNGKNRLDLLPFDALEVLGEVYTKGAAKYAERNWELGMKWSKVLGPLMRHLVARVKGEKLDGETGLPHLAHVAWNAIALLTYEIRSVGEDDVTMKEKR